MKNLKKLIGFVFVFAVLMAAFYSVGFAAIETVTWNPNDKGSQTTLSNNNLTASSTTFNSGGVRATKGVSTGKWYWEVKFDGGTCVLIGIANQSSSFQSCVDTNYRNYYSGGTKISDIETLYGTSYGSGDIIGIALDMDNGTIIFYKNGVSQGVAYNDIKSLGTVFPFLGTGSSRSESDTGTANFGATEFSYTIPDGYHPYDDSLIELNAATLTAKASNTEVDLSWNAVDGATSYNVKRSLISSGPYDTLTTTSAITYTDKDVTNGTAYYYVVTAVCASVESDNSNEVSATPAAPVVVSNSGILEITMTNGAIKEYDLTAAELKSFITWFDGKSNGTDKPYYIFNKKNSIKPFLSRKEYISFDKISSFEVKEYAE